MKASGCKLTPLFHPGPSRSALRKTRSPLLKSLHAAAIPMAVLLSQSVAAQPVSVQDTAVQSSADPAAVCASRPDRGLDWQHAQRRLIECNRDVRIAVRTARAAQTDIITAGQRPNPVLSTGVGQYAPSVGLGSGGPLDWQLDWLARYDQTIERGNKRGLRIESAQNAWIASQWDAVNTLRQQQLALALNWIDLWGAQEKVRLQREITSLFRRTLDAAQIRLKAGDIAANDVARIHLDLQRSESDQIAADAELSRARNTLAALLAIDASPVELTANEPWAVLAVEPDVSRQPLDDAALEGRPDLQAARAQQAAAEARSRLARSLQTRDVSVGLQVDRYAPPSGLGWLFGVYVSFPLFLNHRYEGEIARAEADVAIAHLTRDRVEKQARADYQRLLEARTLAQRRQARIELEALPLAEKVAANADLAYRKGAGSVLELLDALRQLRALQLEALTARLEVDRADASARAERLGDRALTDPVFGGILSLRPEPPESTTSVK